MTNIIEKGLEALEIDFKEFWDNVALPDIRKGEQIALNIAKELEPLAEEAGQAIFGAGIAAMSVASNGVIPADGAAAMKLLSVGVDAALAKASVLRVQLSPQVVTTVLSGLSIPAPKVANGANG